MKKISICFFMSLFVSCSFNKKFAMKKQHFKFDTAYNQFYLIDKGETIVINQIDFWNEEAFLTGLALGKGIIGVKTKSYGNIKGQILILEKPVENIDFELYDYIVEGGINLQSGELQILDCPNNHIELSLKISSGKYRVRVYGINFASVKEPDFINDTDDDFYKIEIWPSENVERRVLKRYIEK